VVTDRPNEITIVGRGPSWKECQFNTEELWGSITCLTVDGLRDKNFNKVFFFDDKSCKDIKEGLVIAKERGITVVSLLSDIGERYPLKAVIHDCRSSYFLNCASFMMAYAIHLKYSKIHLYGIDQGPSWELQQGKPHVCFWTGFALGRGIEVIMGRGSLRWAYNVGIRPDSEPNIDPYNIRDFINES
jgi:hypothetical protein